MKKIVQDRSKCLGCLACVGLAPELFEAEAATGLAKLKEATGEEPVLSREVPDETANLEMLPSACCGGAISVE